MEGDDAAALDAWPQRVRSVVPLGGGWNSGTWSVESEQGGSSPSSSTTTPWISA